MKLVYGDILTSDFFAIKTIVYQSIYKLLIYSLYEKRLIGIKEF